MATRFFELARSTGLVMGSTMLIKELVLPKMHFSMPDIIYGFKALMRSLRAAAMRSAENGTSLAGKYPKTASAYAMIILAVSATKLINELRLLAHLIAHHAGIATAADFGMYGWRLMHARDNEADDVSGSSSQPPSSATSDAEDLDDAPEEPDAAATGTEGTGSDEDKDYKDYTTFWETRPTRDMSKQLSSQEIDVYKTDLNIATLEDWKLKVLTLMRRRYPQFGALLQLAWADESNEQLLEIIADNEHAATANVWGASALLALIEVTKPKGKVFEHELLGCRAC